MIVTIDGPAGTGKSTAARGLAARLGFGFLDTGAMYRAVAWSCLQRGVDFQNPSATAEVARSIELAFDGSRTLIDGRDASAEIRSGEATRGASVVAQHADVRAHLVDEQRRLADVGDFVCEGRDQGTVAFPDAGCKFFLTADPRERAARRQQELAAKGEKLAIEVLLAEQAARDERDASRAVAPLRPADDAIVIDTTAMTSSGVVDLLEQHVRGRYESPI